MAWVRVDDGFPEHPKLRAAGPLGRELFIAALCHCNRYLTDGRLTMEDLRRLAQYEDIFVRDPLAVVEARPAVEDVLERLIFAGAFEWNDGVIHIHDYADFQPTKAQILERREADRERKRLARAGFSKSKVGMSARTPGRGPIENHLEPARARPCEECGVGAGLHVVGCSRSNSGAVA